MAIILNKKKKEMETFVQMLALTNFSMMVKKGLCTAEEWNDTATETVEALVSVQERGGDFNEIIAELRAREDNK